MEERGSGIKDVFRERNKTHLPLVRAKQPYFHIPRAQSPHMASNPKDTAFNILGSSKLNTADGKNPISSTASTSIQPGTASGQKNSDEYRQECNKAHDALENRLRDEVKI